jgi:hypothetical protein
LSSVGSFPGAPTLPIWLGRATVSNSMASGRYCRAIGPAIDELIQALVRHGAEARVALAEVLGDGAEDIQVRPRTVPNRSTRACNTDL